MNRVDQISKGFLSYLKKTGQLDLLPELARLYLRQVKTKQDPNLAHVYTAIPLSRADLTNLEAVLTQVFSRQIQVKNTLKTDLIGGLYIRIGDKVIDLSLKTKLDSLQNALSS